MLHNLQFIAAHNYNCLCGVVINHEQNSLCRNAVLYNI